MASRKRNEWLDAGSDDEVEENSEFEEESRGQSLSNRSTKRRKLESDDDSEVDYDGEEREQGQKQTTTETALQVAKDEDSQGADDAGAVVSRAKKSNAKLERKFTKSRDASSRSGVIYISRVPPFMKPHTLKNLLSPYAPSGIGRIFLTPESPEARQSRLKGGGNKKKTFTDGWVEFVSKKEAKIVVDTLNTRTIGGKKGGYYVDDVWNLKYLKGFKWRHLTEQIANENAERSARMRAEGASSRREMNEFLRNVDKAKIEETRDRKRKARGEKLGVSEEDGPSHRTQSVFAQNKPIQPAEKKTKVDQPEDVQRVLSKIF